MGLSVQSVPGDGSCLFHCFATWCSQKTALEWRHCLTDQIETRAAAGVDGEDSSWFFKRSLLYFGDQYSTFEELMQGMRMDAWGYCDYITEFVR